MSQILYELVSDIKLQLEDLSLFLRLKHYLIKSSEGFSLSFVVWVTLMTNGTTLLCCCHKTYFMDPILIHMRFHSHLFTLTKHQCFWGYLPGRTFWCYFVCIWPLKHNKLCLLVYLDYLKLNLVLAVRLGCNCECTEKLLWSARVPKDLKRRANNTFLWRCNNERLGNWQFCQLYRNVS